MMCRVLALVAVVFVSTAYTQDSPPPKAINDALAKLQAHAKTVVYKNADYAKAVASFRVRDDGQTIEFAGKKFRYAPTLSSMPGNAPAVMLPGSTCTHLSRIVSW